MMKILMVVLCLTALVLIGCSSSQIKYTQDEIKDYPVEMQEHIIKGEVIPGMTPTQVRYAWGAPDEVRLSTSVDGRPQELWTYSSTMGMFKTRLTFIDGKLTSIVSSEPGRVK
ncbi:MAG TPA: hypothetical protein VK452_04335 [Dissulfurispiraceae bacterium]|nr:hypothetical protein [Dissulfurispiraceae bacterium]